MPTCDGRIDHLPGAILLEGQKSRLLSLKQLEKVGYSIRWHDTGPIEILRPDKSVCAHV